MGAKDRVEARGFRVLHALTDSLWIHKPGTPTCEYEELVREIERGTNLPIGREGIYPWVAFLFSRSAVRPAKWQIAVVFPTPTCPMKTSRCFVVPISSAMSISSALRSASALLRIEDKQQLARTGIVVANIRAHWNDRRFSPFGVQVGNN